MERRIFKPKKTSDLRERAKPYIGKTVTVVSWYANMAAYPDDTRVGFVQEIALDIPESELVKPSVGPEMVKE